MIKKRLAYQSCHRGTKENDVILGNFWIKFGHTLSDDEIQIYDRLLDEKDQDIFEWILGTHPIPDHYESIIHKIRPA
jgi:antitoxin CptB